jgi:putative oxidoreductase
MAATETQRFKREGERAPREARGARPADPGVGPGAVPSLGLLAGRAIVGFVIAAHGWQKISDIGPAKFGQAVLAPAGVPMTTTVGWLVTLVELVGGLMLIVGLLTRLAALALTIDMVMAIILVTSKVGLISPSDKPGTGMELNLALIAGFLVALFCGPGRFALDRVLGVDGRWGRART